MHPSVESTRCSPSNSKSRISVKRASYPAFWNALMKRLKSLKTPLSRKSVTAMVGRDVRRCAIRRCAERIDPSVEELELPELVILCESAIGLALYERLADHEVARHGPAAVGVELAELVTQVIFAQEEVEACHGQKVVIVAGAT